MEEAPNQVDEQEVIRKSKFKIFQHSNMLYSSPTDVRNRPRGEPSNISDRNESADSQGENKPMVILLPCIF